jgi:hypothetical protein
MIIFSRKMVQFKAPKGGKLKREPGRWFNEVFGDVDSYSA